MPAPGDLPDPRIEPRSSAVQADSLPAEPQGKAQNTGVGSLSLLQGIFYELSFRILKLKIIRLRDVIQLAEVTKPA